MASSRDKVYCTKYIGYDVPLLICVFSRVEWRKNKRKRNSDSKSFGSTTKKKKTVINVVQPSSHADSLSPLNNVIETKKHTPKKTIRSTDSGNTSRQNESTKNVSSKGMESLQSPAFSRGDNKGTSSGWDVTPGRGESTPCLCMNIICVTGLIYQ